MKPVRVLAVASEIYPIIKTGGLADVAGALPIALKGQGIETRTLVPGYPDVMNALEKAEQVLEWPLFFGGTTRLLAGKHGELDLFVLDAPHLFARPGNPYLSSDGADWPDNGLRFAALSRMADNIGLGAVAAFVPDIVHAHDWQAALTPAYLHYSGRPRPRTVMTVHNLAFQGRFPRAMLEEIGLPPNSFNIDGVEYYGDIGFLKAGLLFADIITTVSPTYAVEIQGDEGGMGLGGLLRGRARDLRGILNGIDTVVWNPATDQAIASRFDAAGLDRRAANKSALQRRFGLEQKADGFLLGVISRLSWQKGLDLLIEALPELMASGAQLAVVGTGDRGLEQAFADAVEQEPERIGFASTYDEGLAHLVQAGADIVMVPSRYEPCGLTQLCALRYGAVPLVARVGGLADTVIDAGEMALAEGVATGLQFAPVDVNMLQAAIRRAARLFADRKTWTKLQRNGMKCDVSWRHPARRYAALYRELTTAHAA